MKKKGLFITLGVFSTLGIILTIVGLVGIKLNFKDLGKDASYVEQETTISASDFNFSMQSLEIKAIRGDTTIYFVDDIAESDIKIKYYSALEDTKIDIIDNQSVKIKQGSLFNASNWWNIFAFHLTTTKMEITIPTSWNIQNMIINVQAGKAIIENPSASNQAYQVQAGTIEIKKAHGDTLQIMNNMGKIKGLDKWEFKDVNINIDKGSLNADFLEFQSIYFHVNNGKMTLGIPYDFDLLGVNISVANGNCNLKESGNNPTYSITGVLTNGTIKFNTIISLEPETNPKTNKAKIFSN